MNLKFKKFADKYTSYTDEVGRSLDENSRLLEQAAPYIRNQSNKYISATAGAQAVQLPLGSKVMLDYLVVKTDSSANTVTITATSPDLINGSGTFVLSTQFAEVQLNYHNGVWYGSTQGVTAVNALQLEGKTWEVPGTIGSTTPNSGVFTSLTVTNQTIPSGGFGGSLPAPSANGQFFVGISGSAGAQITGKGSLQDVTIYNDALSTAAFVPTGTTNWHIAGGLITDGTSTLTGLLTASAGINTTGFLLTATGFSTVPGSLEWSVANGFRIAAITGSGNDFALVNAAGSTLALAMPTGTANLVFGGAVIHANFTVAGLPAAVAGNHYGVVFVSDATAAAGTSIGGVPAGGGAVTRAVYSTGAAWLYL